MAEVATPVRAESPTTPHATQPSIAELVTNDICIDQAPSPEMAVKLIPDWSSILPAELNSPGGFAKLFDDTRVTWALEHLGGVAGQTVLELGPLEGGHTYMLHKAGARSITAIEANKRCYLKCLIAKELMGTDRARFLLGDFMPWLEAEQRSFDVVWVAGVLYHMVDPMRLLQLVGACTNKIHVWTHYVPDEGYKGTEPWTQPIVAVEDRMIKGRVVPHYVRRYFTQTTKTSYCGGVFETAAWLRRSDILDELKRMGFTDIKIGFEEPDHPHGPSFAIAASRPYRTIRRMRWKLAPKGSAADRVIRSAMHRLRPRN